MEENKIEELEPITPDMNNEGAQAPMKEYEKLLLAERNRVLGNKAESLIKLGCFEQKQQDTFDFEGYSLVASKRYRGLYDLYLNDETMQLVFVCPLVENNQGDENERLDLEPYAYDCIYLEAMDDETYNAVLNAGAKNINKSLPIFYILVKVFYWFVLAITIFTIISTAIDLIVAGTKFLEVIRTTFYYCGSLTAAAVCGAPLVFLMDLKYKDYKNNK